MALTGRSGVPVVKASTSKLFQPNTRSAGVSSGSPQSRSIGRTVAAAVDLDAVEHAAHRLRQRRPPFRHQDRAARIGDAGERMRQDDARIGEQAAPVAGMMSALAQIDEPGRSDGRRGHRERSSAGRARCAARPRRSADRLSADRSLCCAQSSGRPAEPISSPISIRNLALKPSRPRSASTAASAAMLMLCWPLLSAVPRP